ncbi:uncharacterized protein LOC119734473 [Patiria miniata]|uniref:Uncharacterized protein n=1 Tax=Patiria miniata TaxID=46514 RepID=A0A914AJM2_PATMI|nr:uncharacterized protein LOC119734473 [Patiria miniata]
MKCFILLLLIGACAAAAIEDDTKALEALMQAIDSNELDGVLENMRPLSHTHCHCYKREENQSDDIEPMPASVRNRDGLLPMRKSSHIAWGWWGHHHQHHHCHCH